ncbi:hypothetical protein NPIL_98941 [Nephila pilipes]|uniref:RNase H type-1 domain-containing protein n=1 Tax=Nephila pilipes TaxID=299642 RepID=A0A8X6QV30_NEPPI|nr:hypothetical protein NPIL_98941 [Nephila pilipes]
MNDATGTGVHGDCSYNMPQWGNNAVILVDSRSAIETIALQYLSDSLMVSKIKQVIRELIMNGKIIEFQWIPSHVDIDGNKRDLLATKSTKSYMEEIAIPVPN